MLTPVEVMEAFLWADSLEGQDFWNNVYLRLVKRKPISLIEYITFRVRQAEKTGNPNAGHISTPEGKEFLRSLFKDEMDEIRN